MNSKKNQLTTVAEVSTVLGLFIALIFGINQWKSCERSAQQPQQESNFKIKPEVPLKEKDNDKIQQFEDSERNAKKESAKSRPKNASENKIEKEFVDLSNIQEKPSISIPRKSGFELQFLKGGTFMMGDSTIEAEYDECPHEVPVSDFFIGKYEITQADWKEIMGDIPRKTVSPNCDLCPIENLLWEEVQGFLKKASIKHGKNYRLPTEKEWEFAAKGGNNSKGFKYSGSNDPNEVSWHDKSSDEKTHPVGQKKPNEVGLFDMSGNVYEWCNTTCIPYPNCKVADCGNSLVIRGGSYGSDPGNLRLANRSFWRPDKNKSTVGFRIVRE